MDGIRRDEFGLNRLQLRLPVWRNFVEVARDVVRKAFAKWLENGLLSLDEDLDVLRDSVLLVVSEMVTNAIKATEDTDGTVVILTLTINPADVEVAVWDLAPGQPDLSREISSEEESGRGLFLVRGLCRAIVVRTCEEGGGKEIACLVPRAA